MNKEVLKEKKKSILSTILDIMQENSSDIIGRGPRSPNEMITSRSEPGSLP